MILEYVQCYWIPYVLGFACGVAVVVVPLVLATFEIEEGY